MTNYADPSGLPAPGGMKQADLRAELAASGRYLDAELDDMSWKDMIEAVKVVRIPPLFIPDTQTWDYTFDGHAGAGPSASERWMNCTASLQATRKFLETLSPNQAEVFKSATIAARQGTTAHAAAEAKLNGMLGNITPAEVDATILDLTVSPPDGEEYDSEMDAHLDEYVDLVATYVDSDRDVFIEARVEALIPLTEAAQAVVGEDYYIVRGSGDTIVHPSATERVLTVVDLKYGDGIDVSVDSNPQLRIYGLGALTDLADPETGELPDLDRIEYIIVQPRLGGIKVWTESVDDLLAWRDDYLTPALSEALLGVEGGATFNPGEAQCQWCPVRGMCPALTAARVEEAAEAFTVITESEYNREDKVSTDLLDSERLARLLTQVKGLVSLHDDLKDEVQRRLHRGEEVPGYHLVNYQPPRVWDEDAERALDPDGSEVPSYAEFLWTEPALMSPTQAIAALKAQGMKNKEAEALLANLIVKPDKRPVAAPVDDRRSAWEGKPPEAMFGDDPDPTCRCGSPLSNHSFGDAHDFVDARHPEPDVEPEVSGNPHNHAWAKGDDGLYHCGGCGAVIDSDNVVREPEPQADDRPAPDVDDMFAEFDL